MKRVGFAAVMAALSVAGTAQAASVDPVAMLGEFNTIVLKDLTTGSETMGPLYVGGSMSGNSYQVNNNNLPNGTVGPVSGSLIVGGDIDNGVNFGGGDAVVGGSINNTFNNNGGGSVTQGSTDIPVAEVAAAFEGLSTDLAALPDSPGASADDGDFNQKKLTSGVGGTGPLQNIAVLNIHSDFFTGGTLTGFDLDPGVTLLINAAGTNVNISGGFNQDSNKVLVNFYEATTLSLTNTFGFSTLAPFADITATGGGLDGTIVGRNISQSIEFRGSPFDGDVPPPPSAVPLPAAGLLLFAGLTGLGAIGRRRAA